MIAQATAAQKSKEDRIAVVNPQLNVFIELLIIICLQELNNLVGIVSEAGVVYYTGNC